MQKIKAIITGLIISLILSVPLMAATGVNVRDLRGSTLPTTVTAAPGLVSAASGVLGTGAYADAPVPMSGTAAVGNLVVVESAASGVATAFTYQAPTAAIAVQTYSTPIMLPSGTGAAGFQYTSATGDFSIVAVPKAYDKVWVHQPVGAFDGTNPTVAGLYLAHMTSTTVGVVYNCPWGSALTCTTALSGVTTGYVTETATVLPMVSFTIPANSIGVNGKVAIETLWSSSGDGWSKVYTTAFGASCPGTTLTAYTNSTSSNIGGGLLAEFWNRGSATTQVAGTNNSSFHFFPATRNPVYLDIDTTAETKVCVSGTTANGAAWVVLEAASVVVYPAN